MNRTQRRVGAKDRKWRRNFSFGLARRLHLVSGRGSKGVTRNRRSKIAKRGIGLLNLPRLRTMEGIEREWGTTRKLGGEIGRRAKGNRRRITKESDWTQKEGETKGRMLAFRKTPRDPKESCKGCLTLAAT